MQLHAINPLLAETRPLQELAGTGRLADLAGVMNTLEGPYDMHGIHPALLDTVTFDGSILAAPLDGAQLLMYYRCVGTWARARAPRGATGAWGGVSAHARGGRGTGPAQSPVRRCHCLWMRTW